MEENTIQKEIRRFNRQGKCIYHKDYTGFEEWYEYDDKGNIIHYKDSNGYELECINEYED